MHIDIQHKIQLHILLATAILGLVVRLTSAHAYHTHVQLHYVSDVINSANKTDYMQISQVNIYDWVSKVKI